MINKVIKGIKYCIGIGLCISVLFICAYSDTHYTRTGFIKHTANPNLYIFTDTSGNDWEIINDAKFIPYNESAYASVKMFTNNTTDYIKDDIIVDIEILSTTEN